jgi:hypothetical protein
MSRGCSIFQKYRSNHSFSPSMLSSGRGVDLNKDDVVKPIVGRGADLQKKETFEPPTSQAQTKIKKTKRNTLIITRIDDKKVDEYIIPEIDDNGNINWELLEKNRKNKPCIKLLQKLKKQSQQR